jgi:hypothetical protein
MHETASGWRCSLAPLQRGDRFQCPHVESQSMAYPRADLTVGIPCRRDIEINAVDVAGRSARWS